MTQDTLFKQHGADTQVDGKDRDCWMLGPLLGTQALRASACTYGDPCAPPPRATCSCCGASIPDCLPGPTSLTQGPWDAPLLDWRHQCALFLQTNTLPFIYPTRTSTPRCPLCLNVRQPLCTGQRQADSQALGISPGASRSPSISPAHTLGWVSGDGQQWQDLGTRRSPAR